jgi:hypothetical protein
MLAPDAEPLVRQLHLELEGLEFPGAFATFLRPFLLRTEFHELETSGRLTGVLDIENGKFDAVEVKVENLTAESPDNEMAMRSLAGTFAWRSKARRAVEATTPDKASALNWQSSAIYGLAGGRTDVRFVTSGADFRLLEPASLPILDGSLEIETLALREINTPQMTLRFAAHVEPISMSKLSRAFGWPEFSGTLAGRIPEVTLEGRVLVFGGTLEASAFGGHVRVENLRLSDPLGQYPRLSADMMLRDLDLEAVTSTFSFGTITGRLEGDVRNLELFQWVPVRFDATFHTPKDDRSRHLISQRAVNNLSSIGGSGGRVGAALQSGVMRFFDSFRYDRLGLSCRLENDVCHMDGIAPAGADAYYLVRGSGIPRIDIIGNARRVSWPLLVEQLRNIQKSGGVIVR